MASLADCLRLNIAHLQPERLESWLGILEQCRKNLSLRFKVVLDLQGAKVRIGKIAALEELAEKVTLICGESSDNSRRIPIPCESVFVQTKVGEKLFLNDRKVILEVSKKGEDFLEARVLQNGPLSSAKGVNSPDRVFEMARVTPADARAIEVAAGFNFVEFAVSFVADGKEAGLFRPFTGACRLTAKIEQTAALAHLGEIAANFDELWLCRGDLGAEAGLKNLGPLQQQFVREIPALKRPCLIAGEVLGSMVALPQPSRAEIVQLYDSLQSGFSGFVLSDETANGKQVAAVLKFVEQFFRH